MKFQQIYIWSLIHFLKQWYGYKKISTKVIFAQAKHETGNFTSAIFKENDNLFGMRQAKVRKNYATGENRGHATFKSLFDSVRDYFLRQKNYNIPTGDDDLYMLKTVDSGYAEDRSYLTIWYKVIKSTEVPMPKYLIQILRYGGLLVALYCFYLIYKEVNKPDNEKRKFNSAVKKFQLQKY